MRSTTNYRRMPRAGLDPIDDPGTALATFTLVMSRPPRFETILLLLDDARCGRAIVTVAGTTDPDATLEVVEFVSSACDDLGSIVVASVRPEAGSVVGGFHGARGVPDAGDRDVDRWLEMSELTSLAGVELLEWFVIGGEVSCPRDRLGEPPRWPDRAPGCPHEPEHP